MKEIPQCKHIISLSFDDGFEKSNLKIAEIYESYGLSACFNVIAAGHEPDFNSSDPYHKSFPRGDFELWNALQARGHEIMPHSLFHHNLTEMSFRDAKRAILRCLEIFERELDGFQAQESIYNFAYNASTPEIEAWLPAVVKAFRTSGEPINPLPHPGQTRLTTDGDGPENCEQFLDRHIERLLEQPAGWLIYNTHGLDDEGWGPIRTVYLEALLDRLTGIESLVLLPVGAALAAWEG